MRPEQAVVPAIEFVAVLAAAFSGFAEARNKKMDPVGVFTVSFITAFGGGTRRDVLLDRRPFFWVQHPHYVVLILALTLIATPLLRLARRVVPNAMFVVPTPSVSGSSRSPAWWWRLISTRRRSLPR